MDDRLEEISVRLVAETAEFERELEGLRSAMAGSLSAGAAAAGRGIESALARAARNGRLEFEELARVAARALGEIAGAALSGSGQGAPLGLGHLLTGVLGGALGLPGRATGGLVGPGRAYVVGESGPELFIPAGSGRVETGARAGRGPVTVHVHVNVPAGATESFMARSGAQIARAVRRTLERQDF